MLRQISAFPELTWQNAAAASASKRVENEDDSECAHEFRYTTGIATLRSSAHRVKHAQNNGNIIQSQNITLEMKLTRPFCRQMFVLRPSFHKTWHPMTFVASLSTKREIIMRCPSIMARSFRFMVPLVVTTSTLIIRTRHG